MVLDCLTSVSMSLWGFHLYLLGQCQIVMVLSEDQEKNWCIFSMMGVTRV